MNEEPKRWIYGYVFYRQNRDASIHRGYLQKSVAILSENNLVDFYQRVIAVIGETYFEYGPKSLDMAWRDIIAWPQPQLSHHLQFPLLGKVIKFPMPTIRNGSFIFTPLPTILDGVSASSSKKSLKEQEKKQAAKEAKAGKASFLSESKISASSVSLDDRFLHTVPLYAPLAPIISKIWVMWELMLTGQPILVLSPSPGLSSDAVLALASLVSPLEFKGDFRPFFTIHDSDFKTFSDDDWKPEISESGIVLGGTNPYFFKALSHWKNIITLSGKKRLYKYNPYLVANQGGSTENISDDNLNRGVGLIDYHDHVETGSYQTVFPSGIDFKKYMRKPDKEYTAEACFDFNEKFVRYHLHMRTTTFLAPLRHFFDRVVASKLTQFKAFTRMPFIGDLTPLVLAAISTHLAPGRNASELKFYDKFIATATFRRWYSKKRKIANDKIASDYASFLNTWRASKPFEGLGEMELVNMYQDGIDQQRKEAEALGFRGLAALKAALDDLVKFLDPDLQAAIRMKSEAKLNPTS